MVAARTGQNRARAEVLDCSATGLRLRTLNPLRVGQAFFVKFPGFESKEVEVVWADGFDAGCRFREPIDLTVFKSMLQAARADQSVAVADRRKTQRFV
jgi:hypothetical protein